MWMNADYEDRETWGRKLRQRKLRHRLTKIFYRWNPWAEGKRAVCCKQYLAKDKSVEAEKVKTTIHLLLI